MTATYDVGFDLRRLPEYRSHKMVRAAKILALDQAGGVLVIDGGHELRPESEWWVRATKGLESGDPGYLVVYAPDNYMSWSPTEAFENGYRLVTMDEEAAP